jgi:hypothetical protein
MVQLFGVFRRVLILLSSAVSVAEAAGGSRIARNNTVRERITKTLLPAFHSGLAALR